MYVRNTARVLLMAAAAMIAVAAPAHAHAKLLRAQPAPGSTVREAPAMVRAWFNEEIDARRSTLTVTNAHGHRVDAGRGGVDLHDLDRKSMVVGLGAIGAGRYTVRWTAVSADDQFVAKGSYRFTVAAAATGGLPPLRIVTPANGATVGNPVVVVVETTADLMKAGMGGHGMSDEPARHLHVDIGTRMTMPTARQLTKVGSNRYSIALGRVRAGRQVLRVYWADAHHKPIGGGQIVTVTVK
jgi:methionine-rich copper-binding protein CopC